jgi:hypothetical protein
MKHGVVFPQTEFGNDVQAIKDYARRLRDAAGTHRRDPVVP